jgi:hypothetical protein
MSLQPGQPAPQFTLVSSSLKSVSLADFKGPQGSITLFPFAFTGVCTTQLCTMRDSFGYYDGLNATISWASLSIRLLRLLSLKKKIITSLICYPILTRRYQQLMEPFMSSL